MGWTMLHFSRIFPLKVTALNVPMPLCCYCHLRWLESYVGQTMLTGHILGMPGWIRTIFAEGPRQAINALTLYSVMEADIIPHNVKKGDELSAILKFFENFAALGRQDRAQAVVLGSMLFTLIVWVFAMLQLFIAGVLYIIYLCHVIGSDSGLYGYCKVRVDEKLGDIVATNHRKELARQQKADTLRSNSSRTLGKSNTTLARQPTVPLALLGETGSTEKLNMSNITYSTDKNGQRLPTLPNIPALEKPAPLAASIGGQSRSGSVWSNQSRPSGPTRSTTSATTDSRVNLLGDQANMGYGGRGLERNPSTTSGSIYTQRSGYDAYGNPESPSNMTAPSVYASTTGRPTPTPSRQQMRPPPPSVQQRYGGSGNIRNMPNAYDQQQMQYGRNTPVNGSSFGDYGNSSNYDNRGNLDDRSNYDNQSNYSHTQQYGNYDYEEYQENGMYPGAKIFDNQHTIPEDRVYDPSRTLTQKSQRQFERYNSASTTSIHTPQSVYPPLPLMHAPNAYCQTSYPESTLSGNQSLASHSVYDNSTITYPQGHRIFSDDADVEEEGQNALSLQASGLDMEIEMTPQTPVLNVTRNVEGEPAMDSDREETTSQGVLTETGTFGGAKSSRASGESARSTDSEYTDINYTIGGQQQPAQLQYTAYNPSVRPIQQTSRTLTSTSPPSVPPPRRAATTNFARTGPIDYFNSEAAPRRVGTAPPATTSAPQRAPPVVDYFGTERTPARVGTAPPRSQGGHQGGQPRGLYSSRGQGASEAPSIGIRRAETAPMEFSPHQQQRGRREQGRQQYPRAFGDDGGGRMV